MIILNFSHPLTPGQIERVQELTGHVIEKVLAVPVQFDNEEPFLPQMSDLFDRLPLSAEEMQTIPLIMNPPSLNYITALLLAELHGRMGYFPSIIRLRPAAGSLPTRYEVAEVINLQTVRSDARRSRYD